jgi:type I restriction enzyme S subunit
MQNNIQTKTKLIPRLRFKEFDNEWKKKPVNKFASKLKVGFVGTCEPYYTNELEGILLLRTGNLKGVKIELDEEKYVTEEFHVKNQKSQIQPNDLLLARHGGNGEICRVPEGFPTANCLNIVILRTNKEVDSVFFQLAYSTFYVQKQIKSVTAGSTQVVINTKEIGKLKINLPNLKEQQKIATFLTAVDTKLQQLNKKKELLANYKKGVMQQLFSQQLRFKNDAGLDFSDWEEKRLGEVSEIIGGGTPDTTNNEYWDGDIQWFTPTEIRSKFISNSKRTITQSGLKKSSAKLLPAGTILFTSRATIAELGFATEECSTNQGFQSLVVNKNNNSGFVYYLIKIFKKEFIRKSQGSTFLEISSKEMKKMKFKIPSQKEQQKIANYLSAIDIKIENVQTQIAKTQTFKKGLLQQMFV